MRVDWGLMIVPTPHTAERVDTLMEQTHGELHVTDVSSVYTALQLVGPRCLDVLQKLTSLDLRPSLLSNLTCKQGTIAKVPGLMLRDDLAAYPSYWIFITREYGEFVWETICDVGKACDLIPMGSETYRCLTTKNSNYGDPS
jgi:heterotetrameric sarcosine oxidase gamma subunit